MRMRQIQLEEEWQSLKWSSKDWGIVIEAVGWEGQEQQRPGSR
jgi:hypothetical protein